MYCINVYLLLSIIHIYWKKLNLKVNLLCVYYTLKWK